MESNKHVMGDYTIEICQDSDPPNPRKDFDNLGTMYLYTRRYNLGDMVDRVSVDEAREIAEDSRNVSLPVYMYDHSGITISINPFPCPWDSGQIGWIVATREKILGNFGRKNISKHITDATFDLLRAEVETYDQYLTGDVWGYVITDKNGDEIDSCWGCYGKDYCLSEAKLLVNRLQSRAA